MGVNDAGDLITVPYDPTVAAAGMRARAANDSASDWPVGPIETEAGWLGKISLDIGATYAIKIGNVTWETTIVNGVNKWLLTNGTKEDAIAAINNNIDNVTVEKTAMAPTDQPVTTMKVIKSVWTANRQDPAVDKGNMIVDQDYDGLIDEAKVVDGTAKFVVYVRPVHSCWQRISSKAIR